MDSVRFEWANWNIVRGYDFKDMVIDGKDKVRGCRRIDEPQEVPLALLKDFAENWLSFAFWKASGVCRVTLGEVPLSLVSVIRMTGELWKYQFRSEVPSLRMGQRMEGVRQARLGMLRRRYHGSNH